MSVFLLKLDRALRLVLAGFLGFLTTFLRFFGDFAFSFLLREAKGISSSLSLLEIILRFYMIFHKRERDRERGGEQECILGNDPYRNLQW